MGSPGGLQCGRSGAGCEPLFELASPMILKRPNQQVRHTDCAPTANGLGFSDAERGTNRTATSMSAGDFGGLPIGVERH
jgi:hypothetical protein